MKENGEVMYVRKRLSLEVDPKTGASPEAVAYPYPFEYSDQHTNPAEDDIHFLRRIAENLRVSATEDWSFHEPPDLEQRRYVDTYREMAGRLVNDFCAIAYRSLETLDNPHRYHPNERRWLSENLYQCEKTIYPRGYCHRPWEPWEGITYPLITRSLMEIYGMIFDLKRTEDSAKKCIASIEKGDIRPLRTFLYNPKKSPERYKFLWLFRVNYEVINHLVHMNPITDFKFSSVSRLTVITAWLIDISSMVPAFVPLNRDLTQLLGNLCLELVKPLPKSIKQSLKLKEWPRELSKHVDLT